MPTARLDVDHNEFDSFIANAARNGLTASVVTMDGPGGGNPCIDLTAGSREEIKSFLLEHYDPDMVDEDFDLYMGDDESTAPTP